MKKNKRLLTFSVRLAAAVLLTLLGSPTWSPTSAQSPDPGAGQSAAEQQDAASKDQLAPPEFVTLVSKHLQEPWRLQRAGKLQEALAIYDELLRGNHGEQFDAMIKASRANCLKKLGRTQEADEAFREVMKLPGEDFGVRSAKAMARRLSTKPEGEGGEEETLSADSIGADDENPDLRDSVPSKGSENRRSSRGASGNQSDSATSPNKRNTADTLRLARELSAVEFPVAVEIRLDGGAATIEVPAPKDTDRLKQWVEELQGVASDVQVQEISDRGILLIKCDVENAKAIWPQVAEKLAELAAIPPFAKTDAALLPPPTGGASGKTVEPTKDVDFDKAIRIKQRDYEQVELPPGLVMRIDASGMATVEVPAGYDAANVAQLMENKMSALKPSAKTLFQAVPLSATRIMCRGSVEDFRLLAACIVTVDHGRATKRSGSAPDANVTTSDFKRIILTSRNDYQRAERRAAELAAELREEKAKPSPVQSRVSQLSGQLRAAVQSAFEHRMQLQQAQLDQAETELNASRRRLDERQKNSEEIIQRRVEELESGKDASWLGEPSTQTRSSGASTERADLEVDASLLPPDELLLKQPTQPRLPSELDGPPFRQTELAN